jgi:hypothetical protein
MSSLVTLANLTEYAKDRADMQNSNNITAAQWTRYINSAAKELYDILISKGLDYVTTKYTLSVDGSTDTWALPTNFYKLVGVKYTIGGRLLPMFSFNLFESTRYQYNSQILFYRLIGLKNIVFSPTPRAQDIIIYYAPTLTALSSPTDTLDGVNGWEEYVVVRAARWALQKEESDTSAVDGDLQFLKQRIEEMAENRDQGLPGRVTDVNDINYIYNFDPGESY